MKHLLLSTLIVLALFSCNNDTDEDIVSTMPKTEPVPNILLIIADDLGKDALNGFTEGSLKPNTPNIDAIRTSGLSFSNFWTYPTCSPTRASILTGKYGYRTGVKWAGDMLRVSETSLQQYINDQTNNNYTTSIIGKWHLSGSNTSANPETFGVDFYKGFIKGEVQDYYSWLLTEDGLSATETEYATTKFTDIAIDWINQQNKPWFTWLAYNAPHTPFHAPPSNMHSQGNLPAYASGMDEMPYYLAAIEAMDFQIGRLLDSISEEDKANTIIIFMGDNGTPNQVVQRPYTRLTAKGSLYQGGINVPLFISGKGVSRTGTDYNLITSTDLFATIAELAGVSVSSINDSKSFKSILNQSETIRHFQYAEKDDDPNNLWTISDGDYKLIEYSNGDKAFFNLINDPYEKNEIPYNTLSSTELQAKTDLESELLNIRQ